MGKLLKQFVDLGTMKNKLEGFRYLSKDEFVKDLDLIFENAKVYYKKKSKIYKIAEELEELIKPLVEKLEDPSKTELEESKAILAVK